MSNAIYTLPQLSSYGQFTLEERAGGDCALVCEWDVDLPSRIEILFREILFYCCTRQEAIEPSVVDRSFDKLVATSPARELWSLEEIGSSLVELDVYTHFEIYVDDGPLYEVVCKGVKISDLSNLPTVLIDWTSV